MNEENSLSGLSLKVCYGEGEILWINYRIKERGGPGYSSHVD